MMHPDETPGYRLAIAAKYEEHYRALAPEAARARAAALAPYVARIVEALALPDEGWLLDVGCGDGLIALTVARLRPRMTVLGVDASEAALGLARRLAKEEALANVAFAAAEADALPEGQFERICAASVFNLLPDKLAALRSWRAAATPGARLVIADAFDARGAGTRHAGAMSPSGLAQACRESGWRVVHREDLGPAVAKLHAVGGWPWTEYVRPGVSYACVALAAV